MGTVMILCTATGHQVSTGVHLDRAAFAALPAGQHVMRCWACGREHGWSKRWATFVPEIVRTGEILESVPG